jgi:putative transposase
VPDICPPSADVRKTILMPYGLERYQQSEQSHFLTFSCYQRRPYLSDPRFRDTFLGCLERTRLVYRFRVYGYVIMPEHLHVLVSEPKIDVLATAIQALKVSFTNLLGVDS